MMKESKPCPVRIVGRTEAVQPAKTKQNKIKTTTVLEKTF